MKINQFVNNIINNIVMIVFGIIFFQLFSVIHSNIEASQFIYSDIPMSINEDLIVNHIRQIKRLILNLIMLSMYTLFFFIIIEIMLLTITIITYRKQKR